MELKSGFAVVKQKGLFFLFASLVSATQNVQASAPIVEQTQPHPYPQCVDDLPLGNDHGSLHFQCADTEKVTLKKLGSCHYFLEINNELHHTITSGFSVPSYGRYSTGYGEVWSLGLSTVLGYNSFNIVYMKASKSYRFHLITPHSAQDKCTQIQ